MDQATKLRVVIRTLKIFGWGWLVIIGIPLILVFITGPWDDIPRKIGNILGILFLLSPGISALYWARR